uniref:RNase H family protein n=1 Tax=Streptomyces sp. IBSBF 2390 TaxID=2903533 RepID=UPI002FDBDCFB
VGAPSDSQTLPPSFKGRFSPSLWHRRAFSTGTPTLDLEKASMVICVDSQAAIKALSSVRITSSLVKDCKSVLNNLGGLCDLTIMWVPGHTYIQGNEDADLLARQGSDLHISWMVKVPLPATFYKATIRESLLKDCKRNWAKSMHAARNLWIDFDHKFTVNQ